MAEFFAVASRGTEEVLAEELRELGIPFVAERSGGVAFGTALTEAYRVCLWSRIASRVLLPIHTFQAADAEALYTEVRSIDWPQHLGSDNTLAVDVAGKNAASGPAHFVTLKTKDAIVDAIRNHEGSRPDIDTRQPDVRINVHVRANTVTVNIDLSGRGLHRRGIDRIRTEAPLKENLAAAILRLAGWPAQAASCPLFDPMCGSGTFLIEAAWMALDVAPGLNRVRLSGQGWRGHDVLQWKRLQEEARDRTLAAAGRTFSISGADSSRVAISAARENIQRAGLDSRVQVEVRELRTATSPPTGPGIIVTNPPYGERLGDSAELGQLYELLGDVLKRRFPGWRAWVFTGNPALAKRIGLRPSLRHVLFNGPIESRLLDIPISARQVEGESGPSWRRASVESRALVTRLRKNLRRLRPWARRKQVTCYRLYDADVPQYNVAIDWYDGVVRVEEHPRPRKVPHADADRRLRDTLLVVSDLLQVDTSAIVVHAGRWQRPVQSEARPMDHDAQVVEEGTSRFEVDLQDPWNPGLGLDHRLLRRRVGEQSAGGDFLNLFAGTCTASVVAALGGARSSTSVDRSSRYLNHGRRNFTLNKLADSDHHFTRSDVGRWLTLNGHRRYDLILLAPPGDFQTQPTSTDAERQQNHINLIRQVGGMLRMSGELLFAARQKAVNLASAQLDTFVAKEITHELTSADFERRPRLRVWSLHRNGAGGL